ncbi:MAG: alpha/beta fold hydrolase [Gemmatimonadota bacterium]|jgi:pimeloyl-ACP methyl ester carboxylesterase
MHAEPEPGFSLPVGYRAFHPDQLFNFQLNRPFSLGYAREEDLAEVGRAVADFADWKREMLCQAERAASESRLVNAAAYFRAAEFYTLPDDPDKDVLYERFLTFFHRGFEGHGFRRIEVPWQGALLPGLDVAGAIPDGEGGTAPPGGTIVLHGGFDSFIEEFYSLMWYFSRRGFRVIGFDGPGQGGARRRSGLPLDFRWEGPVGAVLDHLDLDDVTLVGLSMGGYFALRAAAFEPRIARVIVSGHAYDYMRIAPAPAAWVLRFFHDRLRGFTNRVSRWKIRQGGMEAWSISQLMYVLDVDEPMAALDFALDLNEGNLRSERVTQDVLVLAGAADHFIPLRLHAEQLRRLTAARSVTGRVFTEEDRAENHCQIGNLELALRVMSDWIESKSGRRSAPA